MNKIAAYSGYAVASTLNYVHKHFYKLAFLATAIFAASELSLLTDYTKLIGIRFYEFTSWYHNLYMDKIGS